MKKKPHEKRAEKKVLKKKKNSNPLYKYEEKVTL